MMPLIAAYQNTQLADFFLGLYKYTRKCGNFLQSPALGLEFNMMPLMQPDKTHN